MISEGVESLSDTELLSVILRTGSAGLPVMDLAERLLDRFSGLRGLV